MIWFTADTHFGDGRWRALAGRPFANVATMDEGLVAAWNTRVAADDEVWHLGDVARAPAAVPGLLARLHGRKHLIMGNNDPPATREAAGWVSVRDYAELTVDGHALVLCHYPFRTWHGQHRRAINLHGHSHGRLRPLPHQYDVGVDAQGYAPVSLAALLGTA